MQEIVTRIKQAGVLAKLPGDLPLQSILQVGDALLAAPVLGVEIAWHEATDPRLVLDLSRRAGGNMLVGVGGVETAVATEALIAAGAQFIASPRVDFELMAFCAEREVLYLPSVISILAAQSVQQAGGHCVRLRTGGPAGPGFVATVHEALPDISLLVTGDVNITNVGRYAHAGADAVLIGDALFAGPQQTMADVISRARALQQAWDEGSDVDPKRNGMLL